MTLAQSRPAERVLLQLPVRLPGLAGGEQAEKSEQLKGVEPLVQTLGFSDALQVKVAAPPLQTFDPVWPKLSVQVS